MGVAEGAGFPGVGGATRGVGGRERSEQDGG